MLRLVVRVLLYVFFRKKVLLTAFLLARERFWSFAFLSFGTAY